MSRPVTDAVLGSRFWLVTDFTSLSEAGKKDAAAPQKTAHVKHDSTIVSFVDAGGDTMAGAAVNKAELFAASHTLTEEDERNEAQMADAAAGKLFASPQEKENFIFEALATYAGRFKVSTAEVEGTMRTAVQKLLASDELQHRAFGPLPRNAERLLGAKGRKSLVNAAMGLCKMLAEGQISKNAVLALANDKFYDASNRSDLLRLAADSAGKVAEMFVGEARFAALVAKCREALANLDTAGMAAEQAAALKDDLQRQIASLSTLAKIAVEQRRAATLCLKSRYLLTDPTGKIKSDRKYQKLQLDSIRNSLRAFRYDMDRLTGKSMGLSERMRRSCDETFSRSVENRLNAELLQNIQQADAEFNTQLRNIQARLSGGARPEAGDRAGMDVFDKVSADVGLGDEMSFEESAEAATKLSHITNDRIRYHFSGAEKNKAEAIKTITDELGGIAETGGSRSVTFRAGADAGFKLGLFGTEAEAAAGGSIDVTAKISVSSADGSVSVTYSIGGHARANAKAHFGAGENEAGIGADVKAEANAGVTYSSTKTYRSLDEFAQTVSSLNMLMTPRPREVFYAWGKSALRGVGRMFTLGATLAGFRVKRGSMDQNAYGATLRKRNVFGPLGGIFLKKRNVEIVSERSSTSLSAGVSGKAQGGLYFAKGEDSAGTNLELNAGARMEYSREISAKGRQYQSFARSLESCSLDYLERRFADESAAAQGAFRDGIVRLVDGKTDGPSIAKSLSDLSAQLGALEDSAAGKKSSDTAFWREFAANAKLLACATSLLCKRADALDDAAPGAAESKKAASAARDFIVPRLANPAVKVPPKIFRESFFDIFDMTGPRTSRKTFSFSVGYDALGSIIDDKMDEFGVGDEAAEKGGFKGTISHAGADAGIGLAKDTLGLQGKIEVQVVRDSVVSKHADRRPWMNDSKTTVHVRLSANLAMRAIVDAVTRCYVKSAGGLDEKDEAKWRQEFIDGIVDGVKTGTEDVAIASTESFLDMTLGEAAGKFPALGAMLGGVSFLKEKYSADYKFEDDTFKTLSFEFGGGGRFKNFTLSEDYDTKGSLRLTPTATIGVNFALESKTVVNDWSVSSRPTANMLMHRAADYSEAGNPDGFSTWLARNKKGVLRLVRAGRAAAPDRPDDKYWRKDAQALSSIVSDCVRIAGELSRERGIVAAQAEELQKDFIEAATRLADQPADIDDAEALEIAEKFFSTASRLFTLAEMSRAAA